MQPRGFISPGSAPTPFQINPNNMPALFHAALTQAHTIVLQMVSVPCSPQRKRTFEVFRYPTLWYICIWSTLRVVLRVLVYFPHGPLAKVSEGGNQHESRPDWRLVRPAETVNKRPVVEDMVWMRVFFIP